MYKKSKIKKLDESDIDLINGGGVDSVVINGDIIANAVGVTEAVGYTNVMAATNAVVVAEVAATIVLVGFHDE